jgi:CRP/FNR family transcriptional regulator, cyclic AMP receptor protein
MIEIDELAAISLFSNVSRIALARLAEDLRESELPPGAFAFGEGDEGRELFVVLSGELEVLKRSHGGDQARVALLGPGDWFGEMSVIDVQPRSASVRSLAESRLLALTLPALEKLRERDVHAYAAILLNLAREMSRRLRVSDGLFADLVANLLQRHRPPAS